MIESLDTQLSDKNKPVVLKLLGRLGGLVTRWPCPVVTPAWDVACFPLGGVGEVLATILPRLGDVLGCEFMEPVCSSLCSTLRIREPAEPVTNCP